MKKLLIVLSFVCCTKISAQSYRTHEVSFGDTIEKIAKKFMVTPHDIIALNPDVILSLEPNMVLIIPNSKFLSNPVEVEDIQLVGYISHKVKRKETIYSISKKYNVSVDDIKKYNINLYSENLRKGDKLKIPEFSKIKTMSILSNTIKKYQVLPKEGKWRIAYKFGISIPELEDMNPQMSDFLKAGQEINVPNVAYSNEKHIEVNYDYYTVLAKEGYYRLKLKLGLDKDKLISLNPKLASSELKEGMVLKVPKNTANNVDLIDANYTKLANSMTNFKTKRLAAMIPFQLNRIDFDSLHIVKKQIQNDRLLSISLDFYSGVLMALDSVKHLGLSVELDVYDTKARGSEISKIINVNDFSQYDAVIGPFISDNFDIAANMLQRNNTAIVSPLTVAKNLYQNVFQTIPTDALLINKMVNYVKRDTTEYGIVIIADHTHRASSNAIKTEFEGAEQVFSRRNQEGKEAFYILREDLEEILPEGKSYVFLETTNEGFVSNVSSMLNGFNGINIIKAEEEEEEDIEIEREIIMITSNRNSRAYEGQNVSNFDLSNLQFQYASYNREYNTEEPNSFVKKYERQYQGLPTKYAIRGFDLTFDILLRLAYADDLFQASESDIQTQYIENKFKYVKTLLGGYYNEAAFIMKYKELKIIEVKY